MLMDSAIICCHFRNSQLPISLKITAASPIRNTLAITLKFLLKKDLTFSSNIFEEPFNTDFAAANAFLVIIIIISSISSSSSGGGGGASGSDINSTSSK